jgi:hypothetical protein
MGNGGKDPYLMSIEMLERGDGWAGCRGRASSAASRNAGSGSGSAVAIERELVRSNVMGKVM